jgi:hypothetical protein
VDLLKLAWLVTWRVLIRPRGRGKHTTVRRRVQRPRHRNLKRWWNRRRADQ